MKICILNIATNKYIRFIEPFLDSVEENFLNGHEISALVFTNHDITSQVCPGVATCWSEVKNEYSDTHDFYEFTDQYESVNGTFLGIGVAVRKQWLTNV